MLSLKQFCGGFFAPVCFQRIWKIKWYFGRYRIKRYICPHPRSLSKIFHYYLICWESINSSLCDYNVCWFIKYIFYKANLKKHSVQVLRVVTEQHLMLSWLWQEKYVNLQITNTLGIIFKIFLKLIMPQELGIEVSLVSCICIKSPILAVL